MIRMDKKPVVKYDRRLKNHYKMIFAMTKVEMDLFDVVLSIIGEQKKEEIDIPASEIISRSKYMTKHNHDYTLSKMVGYINSMSDKAGSAYYVTYNNDVLTKMFLFDTFAINLKSGDVKIKLGTSFSHYFFDIEANRTFTQYYLANMLTLKSKYSKILYRLCLDNHNGFTVNLHDFCEIMQIKNAATLRTVINRLPEHLKPLSQIGDFEGDVRFVVNKDPNNRKKNKSITFVYTEKQKRIKAHLPPVYTTIDVEPESEFKGSNRNELECPYCGDRIIKRYNKQQKTSFWGHVHFADHKGCPLQNQETEDLMIAAIDAGKKKIKAEHDKIEYKNLRDQAIQELKKEYPNGIDEPGDLLNPSQDDIERRVNGFSANDIAKKMQEIAEAQKKTDPFPGS